MSKKNDINDFMKKVNINSETECWNWLCEMKKKTPLFSYEGFQRSALRYIWKHTFGDFPDVKIYRKCRNSFCVNTKHLMLAHTIEKVFWDNVDKLDNGCWKWRNKTKFLKFDNKNRNVYKLSLELCGTKNIGKHDSVKHTCDMFECVNPEHLYLMSNSDVLRERRKTDKRMVPAHTNTNYYNTDITKTIIDNDFINVFNSYINKLKNGCHIWTGRINSGGPSFSYMLNNLQPIVVNYYLKYKIRVKHTINYCGNRACISPEHNTDGINLEKYFYSKISKDKNNCWNWNGTTTIGGYGKVGTKGTKFESAHRFAWGLLKGKIPKGKLILHSCNNRRCVNPEHLRPGTHKENMKDLSKARKNGDIYNPKLILNDKKIEAIKDLYECEWQVKDIAKLFSKNKKLIENAIAL